MDNIDKKILHLLQENARYPLKHLASKVFLSSPAVSARIERLEKSGIISGYHASVAPVSLGYHITAFINMALDPKRKPEFYPFIQACPNVLECNCVTGAYSMLINASLAQWSLILSSGNSRNTETQKHRSYSPLRFRHVALMSVQPMRTKTKMVRMISCKIHGYNNRAVDEQQPLFFIIVRN
jgi:hypothetical protein